MVLRFWCAIMSNESKTAELSQKAHDLAEEVMRLGYNFHECTDLRADEKSKRLIQDALDAEYARGAMDTGNSALQESAFQLLRILEEKEKQYERINKQIQELQGDFPTRIHVMDDRLWGPTMQVLDQILGEQDIASYYYFECRSMKNGGMIVENGKSWPIKTLDDVRIYMNRNL